MLRKGSTAAGGFRGDRARTSTHWRSVPAQRVGALTALACRAMCLSVVRRLFVVLFAAAVLLSRGGVAEALENVAHVAAHGHAAHSTESGDKHSHQDIEHGCMGGVHICPCCAHAPMAFAVHTLWIPAAALDSEQLGLVGRALRADGIRTAVDRPPMS